MKIIIEDAGDFHEAVSLGMCHYKENNCPESVIMCEKHSRAN